MKLFGNAACALFLGLVAASCNNNDTPEPPTQTDMKRVEFKTLKDVVESETPTDNVQGDKREYIQIVRKQESLTPVELIQNNSNIAPCILPWRSVCAAGLPHACRLVGH